MPRVDANAAAALAADPRDGADAGSLVGLQQIPMPAPREDVGLTLADPSKLPADVEAVLRRSLVARVRLCYERGLEFAPAVPGSVGLVLDVASNGEVRDVRAVEPNRDMDPGVVTCVVANARRVAFEPVDSGAFKVRIALTVSKHDPEAGASPTAPPSPGHGSGRSEESQ